MVKIKWDIHRWETIYNLNSMSGYIKLMENQFAKVSEIEKESISKVPIIKRDVHKKLRNLIMLYSLH